MQWLKSSLQPKGPGFNPFPNYFFQQMKWMKKSIKHLNILKKLVIIQAKKTKCQSQTNSPWSKRSLPTKKATSLRNNDFSRGKGPSFLGKSARNNVFSMWKCQVPWGNICFKSFCNDNH